MDSQFPEDAIYKDETKRNESFAGWPGKTNFVRPEELADNGFVYTGIADKVRCVFCGATFEEWEEGDSPYTEHREQSPGCPLVKIIERSNIVEQGIIIS